MRPLATAALTTGLLAFAGTQALASPTPTLVVDDDRVQCAQAEYTSIQVAVEEAPPGALVRVCPGRYEESVTVTKPLTIKGPSDTVDALDCLQPTMPELATDQYALVDPPDDAAAAFALAANDIDLAGFAVAGQPLGIMTSGSFAGYGVHHNLLADNEIGVDFNAGVTEASRTRSRFDHNCLRTNTFGLTVVDALVQARIDHNTSFKTVERAFEAAPGRVQSVTLDHNESRLDDNAYLIWHSTGSRIVDNTLDSVRIGIEVGSVIPNQDLEVSRNLLFNSPGGPALTGIGFSTAPSGDRSTRVLVAENTITGHSTGIAIGGPPGASTGSLTNAWFSGNVTSHNRQRGIRLRGGNDNLVFRGNVADDNGLYGIDAQCGAVLGLLVCPVANVFEANSMFGNGLVDARDQARERNTWIANRCLTDSPGGTICEAGPVSESQSG